MSNDETVTSIILARLERIEGKLDSMQTSGCAKAENHERTAQLKAITSRPYVTAREDLGDGTERIEWRNGSREWATTQTVRRVAGAKARDPHAEARRAAAEAKAEKDALLKDIRTLAQKPKVTPAEVKAVADRHGDKAGNRK